MLADSVYDKTLPTSQSTCQFLGEDRVPTEEGRQPRGFPTSYTSEVYGDGTEAIFRGLALPALVQALFTPLPSFPLPTNTHTQTQTPEWQTANTRSLGLLQFSYGRWQKTTVSCPSQQQMLPAPAWDRRQVSNYSEPVGTDQHRAVIADFIVRGL